MDAADRAQPEQDAELASFLEEQHRKAALAGPGAAICADCGTDIPDERRKAVPSAIRCFDCQAWFERIGKLKS